MTRHRRPAVLVLLLTLMSSVTWAPASRAHTGGSPEVQLWIDPNLDLGGVEVDIATRMAPALRLRSVDGTPVALLDEDGHTIVEVSGQGVAGNLAIERWYTGNDPNGLLEPPTDIRGEDLLDTVSTAPVWEHYDHRLHPAPLTPTLEVAQAGQDAVLGTTVLPLRVGGERVEVEVTTLFRPSGGIYRAFMADDAVQPAGVTLVVVDGPMPRLVLTADPGAEPVVVGAEGEPMVRILPDGTAEANLSSPTWREVRRMTEGLVPTGLLRPDAVPRWETIGGGGTVEWADPRIDPALAEPTDPAAWLQQDNEVLAIGIPVRVDGQVHEVGVRVVWTRFGDPGAFLEAPEDDDGGLPGWVRTVAVAVVAAGALLAFARPGRRRSPRDAP